MTRIGKDELPISVRDRSHDLLVEDGRGWWLHPNSRPEHYPLKERMWGLEKRFPSLAEWIKEHYPEVFL